MAYFDISNDDVKNLDGKVAIITGASSGIGLATSQLFLLKGATVVGADLQPPTENMDSAAFHFHKADVTSWKDLCSLFSETFAKHGRIDIVFANAGIGRGTDFLSLEKDDAGDLIEPTKRVLDVNIIAVTNQVALGIHYMQQQEPKGGNIVLTASCTGYQRFRLPDYVAAKHGVVGLLRSMYTITNTPERPIQINAVAPSFTRSNLVTLPDEDFKDLDIAIQPASAVATSVGLLVSDDSRHGQCLYSRGGRYVEMEEPLQDAMLAATGQTKEVYEETERVRVHARYAEIANRK